MTDIQPSSPSSAKNSLPNTATSCSTNWRSRPLVFVPTYEERENAERLCRAILDLGIELDILFLDDNSPDGTGEILDRLAMELPQVKVIHRTGRLGIGSAHHEGIRYAYKHGYQTLITMDCDFTHPPEYVRRILEEGKRSDKDIIVGSRYMQQDSLPGWNMLRRSLTRAGHVATRLLLNMSFDATGALRLYRLDRIPRYAFDSVYSKGYSFFFESLYVLHHNGFSVHEFPISLPARTYGHSKMSLNEALRSIKLLGRTFFVSIFNPEHQRICEPLAAELIDKSKVDNQGWEEYWDAHKQSGRLLYDAIASMYRKLLIGPTLNHFVRKHFKQGERILHAGCGSGQVDAEVNKYASVVALDISVNALNYYKRANGDRSQLLHGSIFEIPLPDASVDGVYNLGVMEHFTEQEIGTILAEFRRVTKPQGRILLYWPPEFGISVTFFKLLGGVFRLFGKKDTKFHPDEVTRLRSKEHAERLIRAAGFQMKEYYFGPRDLFTCVMIMAVRPGDVADMQPARAQSAAGNAEPVESQMAVHSG
jgi:dolichol-phosphate mannosyltransferase